MKFISSVDLYLSLIYDAHGNIYVQYIHFSLIFFSKKLLNFACEIFTKYNSLAPYIYKKNDSSMLASWLVIILNYHCVEFFSIYFCRFYVIKKNKKEESILSCIVK